MSAFDEIPIIDVGALYDYDIESKKALAATCRTILRDVGFAYIINHEVPEALINRVRDESKKFFDQPMEEKKALAMNAWHRGYMAPNSSTIVTSSVANNTKPNQSESFLVMHELAPDDPDLLAGKPLQGPNQWPEQQPALRAAVQDYVAHMEDLSRRLTELIALCLELPADYFRSYFERPTTFLRLLHYPPTPIEDGLFGSAPHTDYGFITLLAQDDIGGLQVRNKDGDWIDAPPIDGSFVMNVADILSHWSGGLFASTPHRVINASGQDRYSQPFFFDPSMDALITPLAGEKEGKETLRYGDYLMERLDKNYRYRGKTAAE